MWTTIFAVWAILALIAVLQLHTACRRDGFESWLSPTQGVMCLITLFCCIALPPLAILATFMTFGRGSWRLWNSKEV